MINFSILLLRLSGDLISISNKDIKLQNIVRFCQAFILTCEIWRLKALISNFATQIFLGTKMVPILSLNSSNSFQFLNKNISTKRTNVTLQPNVVPQMVPKKSFSKIVNSELSSDVSAMRIAILDQKIHTCQYS